MDELYYVVFGCGNPACLPKEYFPIINALSYDSARKVAAEFRIKFPPTKCEKCGRKNGYYTVISEYSYTKGPSHIM